MISSSRDGVDLRVHHQFVGRVLGHFGAHVIPGATGLDDPLLGAGQTHKGTGQNHKYAKNVERALKWLITKQAADGNLGDCYAHAICTICLCEAYGMTADPALRGPARITASSRSALRLRKSGCRPALCPARSGCPTTGAPIHAR